MISKKNSNGFVAFMIALGLWALFNFIDWATGKLLDVWVGDS